MNPMETTMDKIILKQSRGVSGLISTDPLWGEYQTYVLDIDDEWHRIWLSNQYKFGAVMVSHSFIEVTPDIPRNKITHLPTAPKNTWSGVNAAAPRKDN